MDLRVTSAARKSQRAEDVPAAIYLITQSDIRQSGLMTLPEILRLAPGVQVAQVSGSRWAVSIRGFNDLYSNKLLVLIDGRSVYSRTFSGVLWDVQDVIVSDIDRVEVIRGPGGVAWGANAVNGVINIITRPATESQGLALDASVGTFARERAAIRYGGSIGETAYRVFSQWSGHANSDVATTALFSDRWRTFTSGARMDWSRGADGLLAQGHFTTNRTRGGWLVLPSLEPGVPPTTDDVSSAAEVSILGRWTRTATSGTVLQLQASHTTMHRDETIIRFSEGSSDFDAQYQTRLGFRHGLVFGGGYRHVGISSDDTITLQLASARISTFNTFFQDEISLRRDLALTIGSKLEYDTLGGWGVLPSARIIWEASPSQRLWAAASRTRRTPSTSDRSFRLNLGVAPNPGLPIVFAYTGNPDYRPERFVQLEAGYRLRLFSTAAIETTVFTGSYDGLATTEPFEPTVELTPGPPHVLAGVFLANLLNARVSGVEINGRWNPVPQWQVGGSYSRLHVTADVDPGSLNGLAPETDGNAPDDQWEARSSVSLPPGVEVSATLWRVGRLRRLSVPSYLRLDARAEFRLNRHMTAAAIGQNLSNRYHAEFASDVLFLTSRVPRSARCELRWEF
jgi:iron complex outermembrane receptor protein